VARLLFGGVTLRRSNLNRDGGNNAGSASRRNGSLLRSKSEVDLNRDRRGGVRRDKLPLRTASSAAVERARLPTDGLYIANPAVGLDGGLTATTPEIFMRLAISG